MRKVTEETLNEIALSMEEYQLIVDLLEREPNEVELGLFGALWSEHCGYKHSKPLLRLLPSQGPRVLLPPGAENAGAVDIGDGLVIVFKIESHNHPSAIEPFQGAATGVGGIVRDVLAMGARPIALLNSLRFGPLTDPLNRHLFSSVVAGISWYGNCIGVPDVGGEIAFSKAYSNNPLVNALCVGLVDKKNLARSTVGDEGNILLLVGSETGRDGIHGASGLASRTFEASKEMRPAVQVGNPFLEKVLIEACLEAVASGELVGVQDLGAAGLTSSAVEAADRSDLGVQIDVSKVHRREKGMNPYEVMLSESQERMLLVTRPEAKNNLTKILQKWNLPWVEIGQVNRDQRVRIYDGTKSVVDVPVKVLSRPKLYRLRGSMSKQAKTARDFPLSRVLLPRLAADEVLLNLLSSPNIASKESVYRQYDHHVQTNTVLSPGEADAAVLRIKGTKKGIALCTDGNGRYCYLDPYHGGAIAVAEACRNISCVGAMPIALTDCLNFGDPKRSDIYYQLEWCIRGISQACRVLEVPVVSGNVSLYNETLGQPVYPTPVVGALGLLEDVERHVASGFRNEGDIVVLLGASEVRGKVSDLAGSEFLECFHNIVAGRPTIDLALESRVQALCRRAIREGIISSAHDCSDGGLGVALAEASIIGGLGFQGDFNIRRRWDAAVFGEAQSRIVVSLTAPNIGHLYKLANEEKVPLVRLGTVIGKRLQMGGVIDLPLGEITDAWRPSLEKVLLEAKV